MNHARWALRHETLQHVDEAIDLVGLEVLLRSRVGEPVGNDFCRKALDGRSQLAHDEGAAGGEVHALVAEGRGGEEAIKSGADLLARAQALYEEIGEAAQVQLMMRRQGSLYLAAAIREALAGRAASRAAASRLTLGWG